MLIISELAQNNSMPKTLETGRSGTLTGTFTFEGVLGEFVATECPGDTSLIDTSMLTGEEIAWFNDYHQQVRDKLSPLLDGDDLSALLEATNPIG